MRNLPAASDFTLSTDSRPFSPSLYSVTVAPGWGLPTVRLVTVPSMANAMDTRQSKTEIAHKSGADPLVRARPPPRPARVVANICTLVGKAGQGPGRGPGGPPHSRTAPTTTSG